MALAKLTLVQMGSDDLQPDTVSDHLFTLSWAEQRLAEHAGVATDKNDWANWRQNRMEAYLLMMTKKEPALSEVTFDPAVASQDFTR